MPHLLKGKIGWTYTFPTKVCIDAYIESTFYFSIFSSDIYCLMQSVSDQGGEAKGGNCSRQHIQGWK